jgi:hypothetical protein
MSLQHFVIAGCVLSLATLGCDHQPANDPAPAAASPAAELPSTLGKHQVTITRTEYGDAWPFTVDSGVLKGVLTGRTLSNGRELAEVTFTTGGKTYYVNGTAKGTGRYAELDEIWALDSSTSKDLGLRKSMSPIINRGLKLAQGSDEPFIAPKAVSAAKPVASAPIRCDQFDVAAAFERAATGNKRLVSVSIRTDLPDNTDLMVSIGRSFRNSADNEEYSIDYLEEKSTVGQWRKGRVVELDQVKWQSKLNEKRIIFQKLGEKLNITELDAAVTISFVVPVNQTDARFGVRNANLTGTAVENSNGLRVVSREAKLEWPVKVP